VVAETVDVSAILRPGVFVLSHRGKVVFVGKSKCPLELIAAHRSLARKRVPEWMPIKGIVFDSITVTPEHPDRIDALYQSLIDQHQPHYNVRVIPTPSEPHLNLPIRPL
jgi:excinuclease UvrABC nuclease subunit